MLTATGVAGRPAEYFEALRRTSLPRQPREYFEGVDDPAIELLAATDPGIPEPPGAFAGHLEDVLREATTRNGVFGAKLMWGYLPDFAARLKTLPGYERTPTFRALEGCFPGVRFVRVVRRDKVAQAVSLWKALQTQRWRDDGDGDAAHELVYSHAAIAHLADRLTAQEGAWAQWLRGSAAPPTQVVYEDFTAAPTDTVHRVLAELGIDPDTARDVLEPGMRRQTDERSLEWIARFREEREALV